MKKFLLHICCAVCSGHVIEKLKDDFELTAFFYNPNIYPYDEYEKRKTAVKDYCVKKSIPFIEGKYDNEEWLAKTQGLENEPEGGKRCALCYEIRLKATAKKAKELGYDYFGTTLSISPHKKADTINNIGKKYAKQYNLNFFEADWKKEEGFKKTSAICKKEGFYRQNYCGCVYSVR
jgi:predicted adenine nucleotide alpha hydrolase (AANH) superfamily ATPase